MRSERKHVLYAWKGDQIQLPNLWKEKGMARLYTPMNAYTQAGYIDLVREMYCINASLSPDDKIRAELILANGLQWLKEQAAK